MGAAGTLEAHSPRTPRGGGHTLGMLRHLGRFAGLLALGAATVSSQAFALPSFELTSAVGGANVPFTVGQAFKQGDVPSGASVVANIGAFQAIPKNVWPDGSLKYAILSGTLTLSANSPSSVFLSTGSATGGSALTTADLRATNITASIGAGTFGSASWTNADFDLPFMTWVSGPQMSSWIYRKPIGLDANLVGWLEVRVYAGGAVEVLPWVENGYLRVPAASDKNATYTFTLNGSQRFSQAIDLLNHQRMVLASGSTFSYWIGADPQITPRQDVAYLQSTKFVPAYAGVTTSGSSLWTRMTQTYTPLAQSDFPVSMGATGYDGSIGPLPEWDVAYLTSSGDPRAYRSVVINGYCAGRYGIHFRDELTNRPPRFTALVNIVTGGNTGMSDVGASSTNLYTVTASGPTPPTFKTSHHPSMGFMAYLLTGRFYFMEEIEFSATANFIKQNDTTRGFTKGILRTDAGTNTTRGAAWALRTLVQAAAITPDADALHGDYVMSFEENVNFYHNLFISTANNNPQGFCKPYSDYNPGTPPWLNAIWMEDFLTFAFGYGKDLVPISGAGGTKLDAFLAWKYQSVVKRLGGSGATEYCFRDAAQYTFPVAASDNAKWDGTDPPGTWFADWGAIYLAATGHANDCASGTSLRGTSGADPSSFDGYWGNLRPAIAYAVDHGAVGAAAAYARLTTASNYATGAASLNDTPVWGVKPRTSGGSGDTTPPAAPANLIAR